MMASASNFGGLWDVPVIAAPMAGGPSTADLIVAVGEAGGFGFVAGGYKTASDLDEQIRAVRERTSRPFGVNLFVPGAATRNADAVTEYERELAPEAARLGVELGDPKWDDDEWDAKLGIVAAAAPSMCSFTFGCPDRRDIEALRRRGIAVVVTVTDPTEADVAAAAGADAVCAQGVEAGAHRGAFHDEAVDKLLSTIDLVSAIHSHSALPVIAAGGIAHPGDARAALDAGAVAVQAGTAFLRTDESGASPLHKAALVDSSFRATELTRAFTGRRARGLRNRFMRDHADAPSAYPEIHHLTRPLRAAAVRQSDADATSLWAGTGHRHARTGPAAAVVEWLASESGPAQ
jgi:nitronate monooxygenase